MNFLNNFDDIHALTRKAAEMLDIMKVIASTSNNNNNNVE